VFLFVWSYFLAPFTPQYGAWKYLYMATAVTTPLAVVVLSSRLSVRVAVNFARVLPALVLLALTMFSPPWNSIRWAEEIRGDDYPWIAPVVRELQTSPDRPVGCLNTISGDVTQSYIAYLCSRMALGLGGFDEVRHRVWQAGSICTIGEAQTAYEWPEEQLRNFTVILFDGARTSSFAGCQAPAKGEPNGWLSSINWDVVRKLDNTGKVVNIAATLPDKK
jgi:hypothetical protein